jgi:predicted MFS family arabinose efflux permease
VDFLDESAGVVFVGMPDVQRDFGISTAVAMLVAFTLPGVVATLLEPPLLLLADRYPMRRKAFVVAGLLAFGVSLGAAALAPHPALFALAMGAMFVANGLGVNLAQATLMDADPERRELWMTRWVLMGTLGDLAAPLLLATLAWVGLGWRSAMGVVALLVLLHASWLATRPFPTQGTPVDGHDDDVDNGDDAVGANAPHGVAALRAALGNRGLLLWAVAVALCGLLDEVFVALASAWLEHAYDADIGTRGLVLGLATAGGVLGLALLERVLARGVDPLRWLVGVCAATVVALAAWLFAPSVASSAIGLFVLEALVAQLYPIVQAQAFRAHPRAVVVEAVQSVFTPLDLALPALLGMVADRWGLVPALLILGLQPIGIAVIARAR